MIWLPQGWFPSYAERIIAFPRGPTGSVSIASWQLACTTVIVLVSDMLRGLLQIAMSSSSKQTGAAPTKTKEAPVTAGSEKVDAGAKEDKKKA